MKNIKNLRQISNARVLLACSNEKFTKEVQDVLENDAQVLAVVKVVDKFVAEIKTEQYDIALIDEDFFLQNEKECEIANFPIPKIILSQGYSDESIVTAMQCSAYTVISKPISKDDFYLAIMVCLNQSKRSDKIEFRNGFYFDKYREQMFDKHNKVVEFTKLEYGLLTLLINKAEEIVDYDTIHKEVWKDKKMSIFTMRNVINKIRQKTYYEIIINRSNKGYIIDGTINQQ